MVVTPEQLRDGARKADSDESEVERRVAASRTCYAAFHKCRPLAAREGLADDFTRDDAAMMKEHCERIWTAAEAIDQAIKR